MQIKIYDDQQAHAMATQFFGHDYQGPGVMKWGGSLLSEHTACLQAATAAADIKKPSSQAPRAGDDGR